MATKVDPGGNPADRILTRWHRHTPGPEALALGGADAGEDNDLGTQRGALHSISEAERELLYRRHVDKATIRELAAERGISVTAVEKRLGRARRRVNENSPSKCPDPGRKARLSLCESLSTGPRCDPQPVARTRAGGTPMKKYAYRIAALSGSVMAIVMAGGAAFGRR